jgi:hypothetical protein
LGDSKLSPDLGHLRALQALAADGTRLRAPSAFAAHAGTLSCPPALRRACRGRDPLPAVAECSSVSQGNPLHHEP